MRRLAAAAVWMRREWFFVMSMVIVVTVWTADIRIPEPIRAFVKSIEAPEDDDLLIAILGA